MTYKKIYMTFNIKRHMHARVIFRCLHPNHVLVYYGFQQAGAFVNLNQPPPREEAAALHPP